MPLPEINSIKSSPQRRDVLIKIHYKYQKKGKGENSEKVLAKEETEKKRKKTKKKKKKKLQAKAQSGQVQIFGICFTLFIWKWVELMEEICRGYANVFKHLAILDITSTLSNYLQCSNASSCRNETKWWIKLMKNRSLHYNIYAMDLHTGNCKYVVYLSA